MERRDNEGSAAHPPTCSAVLNAICQCECQLKDCIRSSLLDVVARDGDAVVFGHVLRGEGKDVPNNAHGGLRRVDVGVADHELLQDVILDSSRELLHPHALWVGGGEGRGGEGRRVGRSHY